MANQNAIITETWSNPDSEALYKQEWPQEPETREQYLEGDQCGGCSYFAPFNADFGLCCHPDSRHFRETVFEHFTCPVFLAEGWGAHSFGAIDPEELLESADS